MAEWLGGRVVVGYTMAASALLTALTPIAADMSFWMVFGIRALTGVLAVSSNFIYLTNANSNLQYLIL